MLLLAGVYIVWFWTTNLSDPLVASGPVTAVERWSSQLTQLVGDRPLLWGGLFAAATAAAVIYLLRQRRGSAHG